MAALAYPFVNGEVYHTFLVSINYEESGNLEEICHLRQLSNNWHLSVDTTRWKDEGFRICH